MLAAEVESGGWLRVAGGERVESKVARVSREQGAALIEVESGQHLQTHSQPGEPRARVEWMRAESKKVGCRSRERRLAKGRWR